MKVSGLDVHKDTVFSAIYDGKKYGKVIEFATFSENIRTMARTLKAGHAIQYGFDQYYGKQHCAFVPFFGIPAATITTTSRFAKIGDAVVIPYFSFRKKNGRYLIEIQPPLVNFPSESPEEDTLRLNALLEQAILKKPEQYLWIHRRFKIRPEGADSVY